MTILNTIRKNLGSFSSVPANEMDKLFLNEPKSFLGMIWNQTKIRSLYLFLFVPALCIDMVMSLVLALGYGISTLATSDRAQAQSIDNLQQFATLFSKNLFMILGSIIGLFIPKAVLLFTKEAPQKGIRSGGSLYQNEDAQVKHPKTEEELQELVKQAAIQKATITVVGAGKSQGKQFVPEEGKKNLVIDMRHFNHIEIDRNNKTATIGAGTIWSELQQEANEHKLAIKVMQASPIFSAGGSASCNIHGWDYHSGMFSNTIESMRVMNAQGDIVTVTPNMELFHHITGGMGLFGIIIDMKLKLTDNELLKRTSIQKAPSEYVQYFKEHLQDKTDNRLHLYRLSIDPKSFLSQGFTETYVVDETQKGPVKSPNFVSEADRGTRTERILVNLAKRFTWVRQTYWYGERDTFAKNQPVTTTNEIMQVPIKALFQPSISEADWLQEYFIHGDNLADFIEQLGVILTDNHVDLLNASVRFVKKNDKSALSYAPEDRFAVVICFNQSLQPGQIRKAEKWLRKAQKLSVAQGGTFYLPYQEVTSRELFDEAYPNAQKAINFKNTIDTEGRFQSGFYAKYLAPQNTKPNYIAELSTNTELKNKFKGFLANILQRVDSEKLYALLEDILIYKDTHKDVYTELCKRLTEIMPSTLMDIRNQLNSLYAIKTDLGAQAYSLLGTKNTQIDGIVEIGSPGRFINGFKQHYHVTGDIVAVNESQSIGDYIDAGSFKPYDQFVTLDYNHLDLSAIKDKSADLITCYVGLHHIPEEQLEAFLKDLRRILRDNGQFLLVDHDITDEETNAMAHLAHFIFNAVNGVSTAMELAEERHFKSMNEWRAILVNNGFANAPVGSDVPMIRQEDPTKNRMVRFQLNPSFNHECSTASILAATGHLNEQSEPEEFEPTHTTLFKQDSSPTQPEEKKRPSLYQIRK